MTATKGQTEADIKAAPGEKVPIEAPLDQWGREADQHLDRYGDELTASSGEQTLPSGQGGKTPHDGISYQDQFPPNPEPSDYNKQWGEYLDAKDKGEDVEPPTPETLSGGATKAKAKTTKTTKDTNP
jgi:hypothetical protein